jgi:hypothetical protein
MKQVSMLLVLTLMFVTSASNAFSFQNPDHKGHATVALKTIKALSQTGSPDPAHDKDCKAKFGNLIGKQVMTTYDINTKTLMMSATSTFEGKQYQLNALGIAGKYAFGVFKPSSDLPLYAVLFQVSLQFNNPSSDLVLNLNSETNCLLSSSAKGVKGWGESVPMSAPEKK